MSKLIVTRYKTSAERRAVRTRARVRVNPELPRLSVSRSNKYLFVQIIDQKTGNSLMGLRGNDPAEVGGTIGRKAVEAGIKKIVFDRGRYSYHGKVKAIADAARSAGLEF